MYKKIFTVLLLAVFMLAQFSMVSATPASAQVAGDITIEPLPDFIMSLNVDMTYTISNMETGTKKYLLAWSRVTTTPVSSWNGCEEMSEISASITDMQGAYTYNKLGLGWLDQDNIEFYFVLDGDNCALTTAPTDDTKAMFSAFVDKNEPTGFLTNPPSLSALSKGKLPVSCNTFEMWALATDYDLFAPQNGYSGMAPWILETTGTFAPPAPVGGQDSILSWVQTFPSTASGVWSFSAQAADVVGNSWIKANSYFRDPASAPVSDAEKEDCKNFTDVAGHNDEVYIRYLADLDLIAGNPDGTFNPEATLTRAEAAALFEKANGYTADTITKTPSAACTFSDVAATDWFAGWVWQACADGFMNGTGNGAFDPSNTLTRGQIVTILNNIHEMKSGVVGSYLEPYTGGYATVLGYNWVHGDYRTAAWTDVFVGDYYALPIQRAYNAGVADGTSATTFSPNQAATRGEFAKMLYRALSRWN